jgi:hypothetical protein
MEAGFGEPSHGKFFGDGLTGHLKNSIHAHENSKNSLLKRKSRITDHRMVVRFANKHHRVGRVRVASSEDSVTEFEFITLDSEVVNRTAIPQFKKGVVKYDANTKVGPL